MIFHRSNLPDGSLIVCGSLWPGADHGAPPPPGYPDRWRPDQPGYEPPADDERESAGGGGRLLSIQPEEE